MLRSISNPQTSFHKFICLHVKKYIFKSTDLLVVRKKYFRKGETHNKSNKKLKIYLKIMQKLHTNLWDQLT